MLSNAPFPVSHAVITVCLFQTSKLQSVAFCHLAVGMGAFLSFQHANIPPYPPPPLPPPLSPC